MPKFGMRARATCLFSRRHVDNVFSEHKRRRLVQHTHKRRLKRLGLKHTEDVTTLAKNRDRHALRLKARMTQQDEREALDIVQRDGRRMCERRWRWRLCALMVRTAEF